MVSASTTTVAVRASASLPGVIDLSCNRIGMFTTGLAPVDNYLDAPAPAAPPDWADMVPETDEAIGWITALRS
jgi:hypothetical protein